MLNATYILSFATQKYEVFFAAVGYFYNSKLLRLLLESKKKNTFTKTFSKL